MKVADRAKLCKSSPELKQWGKEYGRFLRRYRVDDAPKHISETCFVVFATEAVEDADGHQYEEAVALKFMHSEAAFRREIEKRQTTLSNHVIPIKAFYTKENKLENLSCQHIQDQQFGVAELHQELLDHLNIDSGKEFSHLLVMQRGAGVDLHDVVNHRNVAGRDILIVMSIAQEIAKILQFLNEECQIIHGVRGLLQ